MADSGQALARRLRQLRQQQWPDQKITQPQLARALEVSVPLISSWESDAAPKVPPVSRLESYAALFSTSRSRGGEALRILNDSELTPEELRHREELRSELLRLRAEALGRTSEELSEKDLWVFNDGKPITIVCGQLPDDKLDSMPYTKPEDPDYVEAYNFADLDALFELYRHVSVLNPHAEIHRHTTATLKAEHLNGHLVLLGGVDWNPRTRRLLEDPDLPVNQVSDWEHAPEGTYFEVREGEYQLKFHPVLNAEGILQEDVGHFYRGPNPYRGDSTVTMCNGMYARGTLGVVKALTDRSVREANTAYLQRRFPGQAAFSLLTRVIVIDNRVLAPDWNTPVNRLHEWPPSA
ncbi:helix-turn-helix domain-containing protein [Nonomuraea sp. NPDC048826]|uniref:helix-turn-helix domain-containing protein n=1 Tax=Nonomuraea sp. NPDC048826 TaxID=3364347 RepID=UPI0037202285